METTAFMAALGEYGPLALITGALIWTNLKHQAQMATRLGKLETEMMAIIQNNTSAMTTLSMTLNKRPCLLEKENDRKPPHAGFMQDSA